MQNTDKIVVISGSTGFLGEYVVKEFSREGFHVVALHSGTKNSRELFETKFGNLKHVTPFAIDVTNEESVRSGIQKILSKFSQIDILCNLVGGYTPKVKIEDVTCEDWDRLFSLNVRAAFLMIKYVLPAMKQKMRGRIVNIAAKPGLEPEEGRGAYGVSKAGLIFLTQIVALELKLLKNSDITINAIVPSIITTKDKAISKSEIAAEEISEKIFNLCTHESSKINETIITMYGN